MKFFKSIWCAIVVHQWTCKAMQGIEPTQEELDAGLEGFKQYSKMYCARCGKESKLNNRL
jgi:hypothetical protein